MLRLRWRALAAGGLILLVNLAIVAPLFQVEYTAYNAAVEGSFISIARVMAQHPFEWGWWPFWASGMPFENAYLPLLPALTALLHAATGLSPARSYHVLTALIFAGGGLSLFWMVWTLSRRLMASLVASLGYSCLSLAALLLPAIARDVQGSLNLRILHILVFYAEGPHLLALALLPVFVVMLHRALSQPSLVRTVLAVVAASAVALSNAFGIVDLVLASVGYVLVYRPRFWWKLAVIGAGTLAWTAPWLSPSMIRAVRANSATSGGDYRYTAASWVMLAGFVAGYLFLYWALRRLRLPEYVQYLCLLASVPVALTLSACYAWPAVIAQPGRYQLEMDFLLWPALVLAAERIRLPARRVCAAIVLAALAVQCVTAWRYARSVIRAVDAGQLSEYKIARWLDRNLPGQRAFLGGSSMLWYNNFTDNPQLHGAHEPSMPDNFTRVAAYTIYTGTNAGPRDAEYSIFWLKALGAQAISVSGRASTERVQPFVNPRKFERLLPVLWRDGDDIIYGVPNRTGSLAHVLPRDAVTGRRPVHGLDTAPAERYVAALDDPGLPPASFEWHGLNRARVRAVVTGGQVVHAQITYDQGWEAWLDGHRLALRPDGLGLLVIEPGRAGACDILLRYTGGWERVLTRTLSAGVTLLLLAAAAWSRLRRHPSKL